MLDFLKKVYQLENQAPGRKSPRAEAERLERTVERIITDTEAALPGGEASPGACGQGTREEPQLLGTLNARMKAFRKELQAFLEQVERLGEGLSPLPQLTESSSFLSSVTSVSRDSPVGNLGKELGPDLQVRGLLALPPCSVLLLLLLAGLAALQLTLLTAAWL